jgi:hypothetical protein
MSAHSRIFPFALPLTLLLLAVPALAAPVGLTAGCSVVNPNRFQCNFPTRSATLDVQYVSMQCGSTGGAFSLQEFQFLATPPNGTTELAYQIPITNQPSLGGVVTAGAEVTVFAKAGLAPRALIDLTPAPTGTTQCSVSISGR